MTIYLDDFLAWEETSTFLNKLLMFHPIREGNRGGQGLFKWDDVKDDKHRENYLGNSVKASVGRWQNNKALDWYSRNSDPNSAEVQQSELAEIKRLEEEALTEALGGRVYRKKKLHMSRQELQRIIPKDLGPSADVEDKISGIGFGGSGMQGLARSTLVLDSTNISSGSLASAPVDGGSVKEARNGKTFTQPSHFLTSDVHLEFKNKRDKKDKKHKKDKVHKKEKSSRSIKSHRSDHSSRRVREQHSTDDRLDKRSSENRRKRNDYDDSRETPRN
ncbi:hypothetical protein BDV3_002670 [Batrachochytrium dendrobatidis]